MTDRVRVRQVSADRRCVGTLITWPYTAGDRSRRGSPNAGTTVLNRAHMASHCIREQKDGL